MPPSTFGADTNIFGAVDMTDFFAPSSAAIISIAGTPEAVTVTLASGEVLLYEGTDLTFNGTRPIGGTVTAVSILDGSGEALATLTLTATPWNFAEIGTNAPLQSYLSGPNTVIDAFGGAAANSASLILGGNQADQFSLANGADTVRGLGGDDIIQVDSFFGSTRPVGTVIDGGSGSDALLMGNSVLDLRNVTFRSIEQLALINSTLTLSASQIGGGQIAATARIIGSPGSTLQIEQVSGETLNASRFQIGDDTSVDEVRIHLVGTASADVQLGNDRSNDLLEGFDGNDTLNGRDGQDTIYGGAGDDRLSAGGTSGWGPALDEVYGGDGNDRLIGGSQHLNAEILSGDGGNDTILGGSFGSVMDGGDGDDLLRATSANADSDVLNVLTGGAGNDTLISSGDLAIMEGGTGNDVYRVNGTEVLVVEASGEGFDQVITTVDLDLSANSPFGLDAGEIERISVSGNVGLRVTGSSSDNRISGSSGADTLIGAEGADTLVGGSGADVLSGDVGNDLLQGGVGADTFIFADGFGQDRVTDFQDGTDVIDLSGLTSVTSYDDLIADHARQVGDNVWIKGEGGDVLIIANVSLSALTADDFLF